MSTLGSPGTEVIEGTAILDFGDVPLSETSVDVVGQAGIAATSQVRVSLQADTMLNNSALDHLLAGQSFSLIAGTPVPGVGFTIYAASNFALWTKRFRVRWRWSN